ncbi:hypothetical protein VQH23_16175 [Pararoseomonas sp. SCSIO 73927]|uniref:DUF1376 domain-containing protein n=1 Tax=Pararoseomonas sp. SCSIO 73927 TaxID=3114537 RepID=UPI0030D310C3
MTQDARPEPLTPPDCDLRDFQHMQLDVRRLLTSETWVLGTAEEKVAALTLWLESWHQQPAASVPNNPRMLAHLSQAGARWPKVKEHALRGWVLCSDGRLYHPVVAEKALAAWEKRGAHRTRRESAAERQRRAREERDRLFEQARGRGLTVSWNASTADLRAMLAETPDDVTGPSPSHDPAHPVTRDRSEPVTEPVTPRHDLARLREGEGEGEGERRRATLSSPDGDAPAAGAGGGSSPAPPPEVAAAGPSPVDEALAAWEAICVPAGLSRVAKVTDSRKRAIAARLRGDFGGDLDRWRGYLRRIASSGFCLGGGDKGWKADIDWAAKPDSVVRVAEGKYDDRGSGGAPAKPARELNESYWDRPPSAVRQLPKPTLGTPERLAWDEAQFNRSAPHPVTRKSYAPT